MDVITKIKKPAEEIHKKAQTLVAHWNKPNTFHSISTIYIYKISTKHFSNDISSYAI